MNITKSRMVSVEQVTAKLDAIASRCHVAAHCYDESAADSMTEFDALKWASLCAQRRALIEREHESASSGCVMPSPFRLVYAVNSSKVAGRSTSMQLENKNGGLTDLAA